MDFVNTILDKLQKYFNKGSTVYIIIVRLAKSCTRGVVGTNWTHPLPRDVDQHGKAGEVGAGAGDSHHPPLPPLHTTHPRHTSRGPAAVANATTNQRCGDYNIMN